MDRHRSSKNFVFFRRRFLGEMMADDDLLGFVLFCLVSGQVIGWGHLQKSSDPHKSHVVRLGFIIDKDRRKEGWGGRLLDALIELAKDLGYEKLVATCYEDNDISKNMFYARNFVLEGTFIDEERWDGAPRIVLSLARMV